MKWWQVVMTVAGVAVAGFVAFLVWLWLSFSGGLDDVLDRDNPSEGDPEVVAAEERARVEVDEVLAEVRAAMAEALGADAAEVGGGTGRLPCREGQHNFKVDDDFDLSCTLVGVSALGAPSVAEDATTTRAVDAALREAGWQRSSPLDLEQALARVEPDDPSPDLPPLRYSRRDGGRSWQITVDEADLSSMTYELIHFGRNDLRDASGRPVTVEQLVGEMPRDGYAVVVGVSVEYFRD